MKIELFNEMFSCYYSTIYHVIREAANKELTDTELRKLIFKTSDQFGFPITTGLIVESAVDAGKKEILDDDKDAWPFFDRVTRKTRHVNETKGKTETVNICRLNNLSTIPLSKIEKMWLKSIYSDPRIKLFLRDDSELPDLRDVDPLFDWTDYVLFDQYSDGDLYQDEHYIKIFRKILKGTRNHSRLRIKFRRTDNNIRRNQEGKNSNDFDQGVRMLTIDADYIEYSERDDRFRLIGETLRFGRSMINISSVISCDVVVECVKSKADKGYNSKVVFQKKAVFELNDDNNALERFLMNFSHYEKEAEYLKDKKQYRITIYYDEADEKDVVIRVLSFGPHVKAIEPDGFVGLITDKLQQQKRIRRY